MGYRGKVVEQERAKELRALAWTLDEIAAELGVAKSSVSKWVRGIQFIPKPRSDHRHGARTRGPSQLQLRKWAEIEDLRREGIERVDRMSEKEFLLVGAALYAGEGAKRDGQVWFTNSDPRMILLFITWLRRYFEVDEPRLRLRLYLHQGLDLEAANQFWSELTEIPVSQFGKPYRAVADSSIRRSKHPLGCPGVGIGCSRTHRAVMGLVDALLSSEALPG